MDDSLKNGYTSGGILTFVGLLFLVNGISTGLDANIIIFSSALLLLGVGCLLSPDKVGQIVDHWLSGKYGNRPSSKQSQKQYKPNKSPQIYASGDVNIQYTEKSKNK